MNSVRKKSDFRYVKSPLLVYVVQLPDCEKKRYKVTYLSYISIPWQKPASIVYCLLFDVFVKQHAIINVGQFSVWLFIMFYLSLLRCVELIICEQMRKYKARLKDINTLEFAENKAKSRLTHIRRSMVSDTSAQSPRLTRDLPWPSH